MIRSGPGATGNGTTDLLWTTAYVWSNDEPDPAELYDAAGALVSSYDT